MPRKDRPILEAERSPLTSHTVERRAEPRTCGPFRAVALDVGGCRQRFGVPAMLDNLSIGGFYLRLAQRVTHGEELLIVAQISQALIALRGTVLRAEPQKNTCGLAVAISQYRVFSLLGAGK